VLIELNQKKREGEGEGAQGKLGKKEMCDDPSSWRFPFFSPT